MAGGALDWGSSLPLCEAACRPECWSLLQLFVRRQLAAGGRPAVAEQAPPTTKREQAPAVQGYGLPTMQSLTLTADIFETALIFVGSPGPKRWKSSISNLQIP